ncbi:MAG: hypothetical protein OXH38_10755 [Chloroflexi bacterium]|nr:hypothetical protein [Chloroflexota bacterium]
MITLTSAAFSIVVIPGYMEPMRSILGKRLRVICEAPSNVLYGSCVFSNADRNSRTQHPTIKPRANLQIRDIDLGQHVT